MQHLLLGNGIDIQFGGPAYTSRYIIKRIKYKALQDGYDELFGYKISANELINLLNSFVNETNSILCGDYDCYANDKDTLEALADFKDRYKHQVDQIDDIMLEDWLFVVHMFFLKNTDLEENRQAAVQGFERLLLDAIYNDGLVQELYKFMKKPVKKFLFQFDSIFTLNYDNNIEALTKKTVYHLHGDFSELADSENEKTVSGYIRKSDNTTVYQEGLQHCYCNALLNYSGRLKKKRINECDAANKALEELVEKCRVDETILEDLKSVNASVYAQVKTKIAHPELMACSDYHYNDLCTISGELHILGMSPNNDAHIFDAILNNSQLTKVVFYYRDPKHKEFIEANYSRDLFECIEVEDLWRRLDCLTPRYNCNYTFPKEIDNFVKAFNALSMDEISTNQVKEALKQITKGDMVRLCKLVKADIQKRNPKHMSTNEKDFIKQNASISYIALQQGILPTVLYLICVMNFDVIKD